MDDFLVGIQCDELEDTRVLDEEYTDEIDFDDWWYTENKHLMCPKCDFPHHFFEDCVFN